MDVDLAQVAVGQAVDLRQSLARLRYQVTRARWRWTRDLVVPFRFLIEARDLGLLAMDGFAAVEHQQPKNFASASSYFFMPSSATPRSIHR